MTRKRTVMERQELIDQLSDITQIEWNDMPDSFMAECYKQCYADRVMVKGDEFEFGVRGIYVCSGCGYAYPPGRIVPNSRILSVDDWELIVECLNYAIWQVESLHGFPPFEFMTLQPDDLNALRSKARKLRDAAMREQGDDTAVADE